MVEPLERFFEHPWELLSGGPSLLPEIDIKEEPGEFVVMAKLPGLTREDVKIEVTDETLTIRAEKTRMEEKRKHGTIRRQAESRSFVRRFSLPAPIKAGEAKASFKDDRLEIRLPRVKETQVRRVDVE